MKHVAFLIPTIDRLGGAEQQVISLAVGLAQRGWKVTVIALSGTGEAAMRLSSASVGFVSLGMRKGLADPRGWRRFNKWVKKNQPEVLHAHLPHASVFARWSRIGSPVRVLVDTIHSPATGGNFRELGYRISSALPDVVTAVSPTAAKPWLASGAVNEENLAIIPNGVDINRFKPDDNVRAAMRRELQLGDEFVWLAVGRLDPVKDHAALLRAFSTLPKKVRLIVAGDGPLRKDLNTLADDLGVVSRVRFLGFEPDVLRWFRAADGFVLCSRWEGLPISLLESSACELPSVVTNIAGAREVLPDSPSSMSVPVGNADALAVSMQYIMSLTVSERHELGRSAGNSVAGRFSLDAVLDRWEALYDGVLEANPQTRRFGRLRFRREEPSSSNSKEKSLYSPSRAK